MSSEPDPIHIPLGSLEYVKAPVTADVTLEDSMSVEVAITAAGSTDHDFLTAQWVGAEALKRTARTADPFPFDTAGLFDVFVQLTDTPEVPIMLAGRFSVY